MEREWWVSTLEMTFWVKTDADNYVIDAAPIARRFIGKPAGDLGRWLRKQGGFKARRIA